MEMIEISRKYRDIETGYISVRKISNYIDALFEHKFIVRVVEFLKINKKGTQPFMEFSLWEEDGYNKEDILSKIEHIISQAKEQGLNEDEMFFDVYI